MTARQSVLQTPAPRDSQLSRQLARMLGPRQAEAVLLSASDVQSLDAEWQRRWCEAIRIKTEEILENAAKTGRLKLSDVDFSDLAMEHSLAVMKQALDHSVDFVPRVPEARLAAGKKKKAPGPPRARVPWNFRQLRIMWDHYRKKKVIPPRQQAIAERVKKAYLEKVQQMWTQHGEAFRVGEVAVRKEAVTEIMRGADVAYSRAKMIVETETTYYYNKTRKAVYDRSTDVTHYLFMAIRDHRTTEWCKSRHGLVYAKTDPLFTSETPPCHWNCRSEILPLTPHNPRHAKLIDDHERQRRKNKCAPLPPEWSAR